MEMAKLSQPQVMGETQDEFGNTRKQYGTPSIPGFQGVPWTPTGGGAPAVSNSGYQQNVSAIQSGKTGDDFLKSVTPGAATRFKNLADYKVAPPTGKQAETPQAQMEIAGAQAADPSYDPSQFKPRQALKLSFTTGKDAEEVKTYNMVAGHISEADALVEKLGNTRSSMVNSAYNAVRGQTSNEFIRNKGVIDAKLDTAINEVNKATAGKAITEGERKEWHAKLSSDSSPEGMHATLKSFSESIHDRMDAVAAKWNTGMGLKPDDSRYMTVEKMLSPAALKKHQAIMGTGTSGESGQQGQPSAPQARPVGMSNIQLRQQANDAIAKGAPKEAVQKQLQEWGAVQ
jgi:hypothetical protein